MKDFPLQDCLKFLQDYPTECIIMSIKMDNHKNDAEKDRFGQAFRDLVARHGGSAKFYTGNAVPKLGDVRGRIVIINRDQCLYLKHKVGKNYNVDGTFGIDWHWPDADRGIKSPGKLYIEDNYMDTTTSAKLANVTANLNKAKTKNANDATWYVTYLSCGAGNASPFSWSMTMNAKAIELLDNSSHDCHFGIIVMDFPPMNLIDRIIRKYLPPA